MVLWIGVRLAMSYFTVNVGQADMVDGPHQSLSAYSVATYPVDVPKCLRKGQSNQSLDTSTTVVFPSTSWVSPCGSSWVSNASHNAKQDYGTTMVASTMWDMTFRALPGLPAGWNISANAAVDSTADKGLSRDPIDMASQAKSFSQH